MIPTNTTALSSNGLTLADWTQTMQRSVLRQMIAVVSQPGILSFAGGLPAPELFPAEAIAQATADVLASDPLCLQYRPPHPPLKRHIVQLMAQRGVACSEEQIFITTGAQQALDVLTRLLLNPGGQVMLEETVYSGMQQVVAPFRPDILTVPTDLDEGINVEAVEEWLASGARPAFLYTIPESHNPLGVSISPERRRQLVELARHYHLPIIEDDAYGFLGYEGEAERPMRAYDDQWVFYVGSFSKIISPAMRLGWMVVPETLIPRLTVVKEAIDLESSALVQRIVTAFLDAGHLPGHLDTLRQAYRDRRDRMLCALHRYLPADIAQWSHPSGGMFVWVELPHGIDTAELLHTAIEQEKVAFIPGHAFGVRNGRSLDNHSHAGEGASHCLRLNFSNCPADQIEDGIGRLAKVIKERNSGELAPARPVGGTCPGKAGGGNSRSSFDVTRNSHVLPHLSGVPLSS
jgi:2-aminoadipate transaminase